MLRLSSIGGRAAMRAGAAGRLQRGKCCLCLCPIIGPTSNGKASLHWAQHVGGRVNHTDGSLDSTTSRAIDRSKPLPPFHPFAGASSRGGGGLSGLLRPLTRATPQPVGTRGKHFAPVEVKDAVAVIRIDGPGKMNTIDDDFRQEIDALWEVGRCVECVGAVMQRT